MQGFFFLFRKNIRNKGLQPAWWGERPLYCSEHWNCNFPKMSDCEIAQNGMDEGWRVIALAKARTDQVGV